MCYSIPEMRLHYALSCYDQTFVRWTRTLSIGHTPFIEAPAGVLQADQSTPALIDAQHRLMDAQHTVYEAKSWFWWFNKEQRTVVSERKKHEAAAAKHLAAIQKQQAALMSDAKSELGLWSEVRSHQEEHQSQALIRLLNNNVSWFHSSCHAAMDCLLALLVNSSASQEYVTYP